MSSKTTVPLTTWQEIEEQYPDHCADKLDDNENWRPDWDDFECFVCDKLLKLEVCEDDPYDDMVLHYAEYYAPDPKQKIKREEFIAGWFSDMQDDWKSDWEWEQARAYERSRYGW